MIVINGQKVHSVIPPDLKVHSGEQEVEDVRDQRGVSSAMKILKSDVYAISLALETGSIIEENILTPEIPMTQHVELRVFLARIHHVTLDTMKIPHSVHEEIGEALQIL